MRLSHRHKVSTKNRQSDPRRQRLIAWNHQRAQAARTAMDVMNRITQKPSLLSRLRNRFAVWCQP